MLQSSLLGRRVAKENSLKTNFHPRSAESFSKSTATEFESESDYFSRCFISFAMCVRACVRLCVCEFHFFNDGVVQLEMFESSSFLDRKMFADRPAAGR